MMSVQALAAPRMPAVRPAWEVISPWLLQSEITTRFSLPATARQLANEELVHHQRQSEDQRTDDIQDDECPTAVFTNDVWELPYTPQSYSTASSS